MKKWVVFLALAAMLCGCARQETFETVGNACEAEGTLPPARSIKVHIPGRPAVLAMQNDSGEELYLCDTFTVTVQTLPGGSLDRTLRTVTGFDAETLSTVQTAQDSLTRYDFVWSCAGENGEQLCRGAVLDDGSYHYVLTALADADAADTLSEDWAELFGSFWAV